MSTKLPYFKFFTSEWLNGDIVLEDYNTQGIFINLCSFYWHKECLLEIKLACKKLRITELDLQPLIDNKLIEIKDNLTINIEFLNEQYIDFQNGKEKLSNAGKKGALIKAKNKELTLNKLPLNNPLTLREDKIIKDKIVLSPEDSKIDYVNLLIFFNKMFNKSCNVVNQKAKNSYSARLKEGYTKENIIDCMKNVKADKWHKENNYQYATIMYFSTSKTLDTYSQKSKKQTNKYNPHE